MHARSCNPPPLFRSFPIIAPFLCPSAVGLPLDLHRMPSTHRGSMAPWLLCQQESNSTANRGPSPAALGLSTASHYWKQKFPYVWRFFLIVTTTMTVTNTPQNNKMTHGNNFPWALFNNRQENSIRWAVGIIQRSSQHWPRWWKTVLSHKMHL